MFFNVLKRLVLKIWESDLIKQGSTKAGHLKTPTITYVKVNTIGYSVKVEGGVIFRKATYTGSRCRTADVQETSTPKPTYNDAKIPK